MCKLFPFSRGNARIPTSLLLKSTNFAHKFCGKGAGGSLHKLVLYSELSLIGNFSKVARWPDAEGIQVTAWRVSLPEQSDRCLQTGGVVVVRWQLSKPAPGSVGLGHLW